MNCLECGHVPRPLNLDVRPLLPLATSPRMSLKRLAVVSCAAVFAALWVGFFALSSYYSSTRPRQPDPATGRIYELNQHGSYAYLTADEHWTLLLLEFSGIPFVIVGGLLARFWRVRLHPLDDYPKDVRERVYREPRRDYEKVRATYHDDDESHRGA